MKILNIVLLSIFFPLLTLKSQNFSWDTITFETPYEYLSIDTSSACIWQIARPQKTYFDAAFSGERAIVTDSANPYPVNNYSYFDIKIGAFNDEWYPANLFVEFKHKFDTDEGYDGGFISISYDSGKTFMNIITDTNWYNYDFAPPMFWIPDGETLYTKDDLLYNGECGFSGHSDSWITTSFGWALIPVKAESADTVILRFNFISDNIDNGKEGWMIDDIRIYSIYFYAVHDFDLEKQVVVYPNPGLSPIHVKLDKVYAGVVADIMDMKGNKVKEFSYSNTDHFNLEFPAEMRGLYIIKIMLDGERYVLKKVIL
jgi:hypothetical protein